MYVVMEFGLLIMNIHTGTKYITRTMKLLGMAVPYLKVPIGSFQGCPVYSVVIMLIESQICSENVMVLALSNSA